MKHLSTNQGPKLMSPRKYSQYSNKVVEGYIAELLADTVPTAYARTMEKLGKMLGEALARNICAKDLNLVVSTAEDADSLSKGVISALDQHQLPHKLAVFWNHHYQTGARSVAPIVNKYLETGFDNAENIILIKSIISGSCVIKTNLLALINNVKSVRFIYILAPVMHADSETNLKNEFSSEIAAKFRFIYFVTDTVREDDGTVRPGIGGEVYDRLGLGGQPVNVGYIPKLVQDAMLQAS